MQSDELVNVYSVKSATEAEIIRVALENEGIRCEISGEGQAGLTGIFDIEIYVLAADEAQARSILELYEQAQAEDQESEEAGDEEEEGDEEFDDTDGLELGPE